MTNLYIPLSPRGKEGPGMAVRDPTVTNNYCDIEIIRIFALSFFMRIGNITEHDLGSL